MEITCLQCNRLFNKLPKYVNFAKKNGNLLFCSRSCSSEYRKQSITINCSNCNKEITKTKCQLEKSKSGDTYCSKSCACSLNNRKHRSGTKHPKFNGAQYRKAAIQFYGPHCEICGYNIINCLEVHHIDKNRKNNNLDNLIVLCPNHHSEIHFNNLKVRQ